jgi:hypothetical protein
VPRYFLICLPALVLLVSAGIYSISFRPFVFVLVVAFVGLELVQDFDYYSYFRIDDWRSATRYILSELRPGDAIVPTAGVWSPFEYYVERQGGARVYALAWPPSQDRSGPIKASNIEVNPAYGLWLDSVCSQHERIWLIFSPGNAAAEKRRTALAIVRALAHRYPSAEEFRFQGIRVFLFRRRSSNLNVPPH